MKASSIFYTHVNSTVSWVTTLDRICNKPRVLKGQSLCQGERGLKILLLPAFRRCYVKPFPPLLPLVSSPFFPSLFPPNSFAPFIYFFPFSFILLPSLYFFPLSPPPYCPHPFPSFLPLPPYLSLSIRLCCPISFPCLPSYLSLLLLLFPSLSSILPLSHPSILLSVPL